MQASSSSDAVLEAFYARVMRRVCSSYRDESELPADEAVARLQQKWKEKLALYTGKRGQLGSTGGNAKTSQAEAVQPSIEGEASDEDDDVSSVSSSSSSSSISSLASSFASEAAAQQPVGRPTAQLPSVAPKTSSSIFAKMLGGKRKLHQLDGSASDDEDAVEWQDAAEKKQREELLDDDTANVGKSPSVILAANVDEEASTHKEAGEAQGVVDVAVGDQAGEEEDEEEKEEGVQQDDEEPPTCPAELTTSTSLLVSADDIAPVSGLSGIDLPLQLAAEYTKFGHRGIRRGYVGDLRAIVLTWPSKLSASESVLPGELIWCYGENGLNDHIGLVKVVSLGDTLDELKVENAKGTVITVQMHQVRRLKEFLIRKGTVQLRGSR